MRPAIILAAITLAASPALAANPVSAVSSNGSPADTRAVIAPRLAAPPIPENAPPAAFLQAARTALATGRTGEAQEALERAESRALNRSVLPSRADVPSQKTLVQQIGDARRALAAGDRGGAMAMVEAALKDPQARDPAR